MTVITDLSTGASYVFHLWQDANVERQYEVSDKPTLSGNTGDIVRKLPDVMKLNLIASDDLNVPVIGGPPNAVYQTGTKDDQLKNIIALSGKLVQVTTRVGAISKGILRYAKSSDVIDFDNAASVEVEIREVVEVDVDFGSIIVIPGTASDASLPEPIVENDEPVLGEEPITPELANAPPGAGNDISYAEGIVGGAVTGAIIGSFIPVVGTGIGALVGGAVGGFMAAWF